MMKICLLHAQMMDPCVFGVEKKESCLNLNNSISNFNLKLMKLNRKMKNSEHIKIPKPEIYLIHIKAELLLYHLIKKLLLLGARMDSYEFSIKI